MKRKEILQRTLGQLEKGLRMAFKNRKDSRFRPMVSETVLRVRQFRGMLEIA